MFRSIIVLLGCLLFLQTLAIGQDISTLDLSTQVRQFYQQKDNKIDDTGFEAIPLLSSKKLHPVNFVDGKFNLIIGSELEYYLLLTVSERSQFENITVSSARGEILKLGNSDFSSKGRKLIGPIRGDLEFVSSKVENYTPFSIKQLYVPPINYGAMELGFDASFDCHININCQEGAAYEDEKNGVMRIRMAAEEGIALCTGTLLNNTSEDRDPIVLTAFHCLKPREGLLTPFYDMWLFDFNYESRSCANPSEEPRPLVLEGAEFLAQWEDTDMLLVRILEDIPTDANLYFNGWDRRDDYTPAPTVIIHHPVGDIKKVTTDFDPVVPFNSVVKWNNGTETSPLSHFRNDFDDAVYQPGSSGAGLFDETGKVIGQLHGGPLSGELCDIGRGYSGRLSESWNSGSKAADRLRDWLDPDVTGTMILEGMNANSQEEVLAFEGRVATSSGEGISNVEVRITGDLETTFETGEDGRFVIENLSTVGSYNVTFSKNINHRNGISAGDLVTIQNHIVGRRFIEEAFRRFAADVNQDGRISVGDVLQIANLIVGNIEAFEKAPSWKFEPNEIILTGDNVGSGTLDLNVVGYKMGDVNNSANPGL